jgi:hypothetical protein
MILLRPDCLVFDRSGEAPTPLAAEAVAVEIVGDTSPLDPEVVRQAAAAVLHYFRSDESRTVVSVSEFSAALRKALEGLGLSVEFEEPPGPDIETDLTHLAGDAGSAVELLFFPRLRVELRRKLRHSPSIVRFCGLRGCVRQLVGAKRWSARCQTLNDQIVDYLRTCLDAEARAGSCALIVR